MSVDLVSDRLDVTLVVANEGSSPLDVETNQLRLVDKDGRRVGEPAGLVRCGDEPPSRNVVLEPGESCEYEASVVGGPHVLRLVHSGLRRRGVAIPLDVHVHAH